MRLQYRGVSVRGSLLGYDAARGEGVISGADEQRYRFKGTEWCGDIQQVVPGTTVDFETRDGFAAEVYPLQTDASAPIQAHGYDHVSGKSPLAAGLLALFLGGLGIHKFYMGYNTQGIILLVSTAVSWLTVLILIGFFGLMAIGVICLIEAIVLLTKSQAEFDEMHLSGSRPWF